MIKVAINGFGRIGRNFLREVLEDPAISKKVEIAAINLGPADVRNIAHLFQYDTLMGKYPGSVFMEGDFLVINKHKIPTFDCSMIGLLIDERV